MDSPNPSTTLASFRFLDDLPLYKVEKPYELWLDVPEGVQKTNVSWHEEHNIPIRNMRNQTVGIDTTGFTYVHHHSLHLPRFMDGPDDMSELVGQSSMELYLEETMDLVKKFLGADTVLTQDWRRRKNSLMSAKFTKTGGIFENISQDRMKTLKPVPYAHLDDSRDGSKIRFNRLLTAEEFDKYSGDHWRIRSLNVWRPLIPIIEKTPLACCDMRTVGPDDLLSVDKVHDDHVNESCYVKYNPAQTWYYLKDQTSDEPLIFINWDSHGTVHSPGAPHAAFENTHARPDAPVRDSIEVRLFSINRV